MLELPLCSGASLAAADTGRSATTPTRLVGMAELAQLSKPFFFSDLDLHPCDQTKLAYAVVDRKQALSQLWQQRPLARTWRDPT